MIRSNLLYHYFLALFLSIKQSGRLLEGLRHEPVVAVVAVARVHVTTVEVQVVSGTTTARASTRRPVATGKTEVDKLTVAGVIAQRREEEVLANLAILWFARRYRRNSVILISSTHINTLVVLKF